MEAGGRVARRRRVVIEATLRGARRRGSLVWDCQIGNEKGKEVGRVTREVGRVVMEVNRDAITRLV